MPVNSIVRSLLIGIGTLSIALGVIGIFLPVMPTTPFLLLGGACYMRSSEKLYNRLLENKYLGHYLRDYYEKRGIPLHAKVVSIVFMWITMSISMFFFAKILWLRVILLAIAIGVTIFLVSQKTLKNTLDEKIQGNRTKTSERINEVESRQVR